MSYFGGKSQDGVYQAIINQIPMHDRYIETFFGGGGIMRKKKLADINIGVEKDCTAVEAFLTTGSRKINVINECGIKYLRSLKGEKNFTGSRTFIYCDPPYPKSTRGKTRYKFDFTTDQHIDLLNIIKELPFDIAISTYPNQIYSALLKDWRLMEYNSTDRSGTVRTEHLYMNYSEPDILHDDSYIGENAGDRQCIKRKISRNVRKISGYTSRERLKFLRTLLSELPDFEREYLKLELDSYNYTFRPE